VKHRRFGSCAAEIVHGEKTKVSVAERCFVFEHVCPSGESKLATNNVSVFNVEEIVTNEAPPAILINFYPTRSELAARLAPQANCLTAGSEISAMSVEICWRALHAIETL
jgi:hypothetical protein